MEKKNTTIQKGQGQDSVVSTTAGHITQAFVTVL